MHHGAMRQVGLTSGKGDGQLRARVHFPEDDVGNRLSALRAGVPSFQNAVHLAGPGHGHRAAGFEYNNRMRICRGNRRDQLILMFRKGKVVEVRAFNFPLIGEHNGNIRSLRQGSR